MIKPWIAVAAIVVAATSLRASEPVTPTDKSNVIAFGAGNSASSIEYRHLFRQHQLELIAMVGFHETNVHTTDGTGSYHQSQHDTDLGLGIRRNFSTGEALRPFLQLTAGRRHASGGYCPGDTSWGYSATGGGEYFVGRRVSFEGSAGVEVSRDSGTCNSPYSVHVTGFDTFRTAIGINFYF